MSAITPKDRFGRYPAIDKHLPSILIHFTGLSFFKFARGGFYQRLTFIYDDYNYFRELDHCRGPEGIEYPSVKKTNAYLKSTNKLLSKKIAWIDNNHQYISEVTFPEAGRTLKNTFSFSPPHLVNLRRKLVDARDAVIAAKPSASGRSTKGQKPDVPQQLVDKLQSLFEDFTGEKATAVSVKSDGYPTPTKFQKFFRACFVAFGSDVPDSLEEIINQKLVRAKSKFAKS